MMGSGPAGESEVLSLLRVISDPNGAKERLDTLAKQAQLLAEQDEQFKKDAAESTARIKEAQDKADADQASATSNLAEANRLLESNRAKERENADRAAELKYWAEALSKGQKELAENDAAQRTSFEARESEVSKKEAELGRLIDQAKRDAVDAAKLRSDFESKLAQFRALAS